MNRRRTVLTSLALLAAASLSPLPAVGASAESPPAEWKAQPPGVYRLRLGDFQVTALSDGTVPQDLHQVLTGTRPGQVDRLLRRSFLKNPVEASINAFLIDTGSRLVLVDTGAGELFGPLFGPGVGGKLPASLRAAGYGPEQVDDILITHLHTDHSGGLTVGGRMQFPNATVHVGKPDVDFFLDPANAARTGYDTRYFAEAESTLGPYVRAGKVKAFDGGGEILLGVTAVPRPGHTPGHSFYRVESGGQAIEFWGDIMHFASIQFPEPAVTVVYDQDPAAASARRAEVFAEASDRRRLVAAAHLPFPGIGHVRPGSPGYDWVPVDYRDRDER